jgi:hypothetical protein
MQLNTLRKRFCNSGYLISKGITYQSYNKLLNTLFYFHDVSSN